MGVCGEYEDKLAIREGRGLQLCGLPRSFFFCSLVQI